MGRGRGDRDAATRVWGRRWDAGTREDARSGTRESENRKADTVGN